VSVALGSFAVESAARDDRNDGNERAAKIQTAAGIVLGEA